MRALVIGADGFVGGHLVSHLREVGDAVVEAVGPRADAAPGRHPVDVRDRAALTELVTTASPQAIYHLAAVAYGPDASSDLAAAVAITVGGTVNALEAAATLDPAPVVLIPGSAEVYGSPDVELISEGSPLRPVNLYGATKVAQEVIALAFGRVHDVPVVATRSFNHIGPRQRDSFAVASFAKQLRLIELGRIEPIVRVGNTSVVRDFSDVRDVVRAYRSLVSGRHADEPINVASGRGVSIGDLIDRLIAITGLDVSVEVDPARVRANDPPRIVGDPARLQQLTGWSTTIPLDATLAALWADARERTA
jgi:GDP-4-dehydro-6-deoxy-D-mannose reductase